MTSIFDTTKTKSVFDVSSSGSVFDTPKSQDVNDVETLKLLAEQEGFALKKKRNILQKTARFLNADIAAIAGGVRGAIRKDESIFQGVQRGLEENIGFSDVIKEVIGEPSSRAGRIGVGSAGFVADVLFSPITYLTLGTSAGLKIGGKQLTKQATKVYKTASKEINTHLVSNADKLVKDGIDIIKATRIATSEAKRTIKELGDKIFSKGGLTTKNADKFLNSGMNIKTVEAFQHLGSDLLDRGGIKFFGKTLIESKTLAKTPLGKAAKALGQHEITQAFKSTLGKMFSFNYKQNKEIADIINKGNFVSKRAVQNISESVDGLFKGIPEEQQIELFTKVFREKQNVIENAAKIEKTNIDVFNKAFPNDITLRTKDGAIRRLDTIEDVGMRKSKIVQEKITALSKSIDSNDLKGIRSQIKALQQELKGTGKTISKKSLDEIVTEEEYRDAIGFVIGNKADALKETLVKLEGKKALKDAGKLKTVVKTGVKKVTQDLDEVEKIALLKKELIGIQNDISKREGLLNNILDSRRQAKKSMREVRLLFDDKELQKVSDILFEGENSVIAKSAKLAGISEADTFKIYLPSKFKDINKLKEFAHGKNLSSPSLSYLKEFNGIANDNLIKKAPEALKRGLIEQTTARLKTDAIRKVVNLPGISKPIKELTEFEAKAMGYKKFSRQTADGKMESWMLKDVHEQLSEFIDVRSSLVNDLARITGFDWATGLFKGYVTSLFPAFHFRNMTSNQFQLAMKFGVDSLNPKYHANAVGMLTKTNLKKQFTTKLGDTMTYGDLMKGIKKETDFLDKGAFSDIEQMLEGVKAGKSVSPLSRRFAPIQYGREVGEFIEGESKLVGIMTGVIEGKSIKQAIKDTEDALFNYGKLTAFEKDIMRRVIPFYTWARKNVEFQIKTLASTPGRSAAQIKFMNGIGNSFGEPLGNEDDDGSIPSWLLDNLGINVANKKVGQTTVMTGFGLPIEEFLSRFSGENGFVWNTIKNTMVQMNPILKFPLERTTGVDMFKGRPITEITNGSNLKPFFDVLPDVVSDELKDLFQYKEIIQPLFVNGEKVGTKIKVTANPFALHIFRNLPTARLQSTVSMFQNSDNSLKETMTRLATGVATWNLDDELQKFYTDLGDKEELSNFLIRMGIIKDKTILFKAE